MNRETNRLLALKYLAESVCRAANLEGIEMTFQEVQVICDGYGIADHSIDEVDAVYDIKCAYQWMIANVGNDADINTLCKINSIINKHTEHSNEVILDEIIVDNISSIDDALKVFVNLCKWKVFSNGNISTALVFVNMMMIQNRLGLLSVPIARKNDFYEWLNEDEYDAIICFLKEYCVS